MYEEPFVQEIQHKGLKIKIQLSFRAAKCR